MIPNMHILKAGVMLAVVGAMTGFGRAQEAAPASQVAPPDTLPTLPPEQIDQLVGQIALYPDPLIAQILPASTYPIDIVKAARMVRSGVTPDQIDQQDWDPSVKAVAHYPTILEMMDSNIDWTQQLGQAFIAQPDDVMQAVQRLRSQAQNLGNLVTTPQEQVVVEDDAVRILPTSPDVIYVPVYDPAAVYYERPAVVGGFISFGFGLACGSWLDLDCDWHDHWFYRPGWTWNHWHDHLIVDRGRIVRGRPDFNFRRGERPPTVWRRDSVKPLTLPGRRLTRPSAFDHFRGREQGGAPLPHASPSPRPTQIDRGRPPGVPAAGRLFDPQRPGPQAQRSIDRGEASRRNEPTHAAPTPAPIPHAATPVPARATPPVPEHRPVTPAPRPVLPAARPIAPTPTRVAPNPAPPRIAPAPAHVAPPPVHIAPPPAAATRPSPPTYTQSPATQRGNNSRGHH